MVLEPTRVPYRNGVGAPEEVKVVPFSGQVVVKIVVPRTQLVIKPPAASLYSEDRPTILAGMPAGRVVRLTIPGSDLPQSRL